MRLVLFACLAAPLVAHADPEDMLVDHPADTRWWLSGQANAILQAQPGFRDPYDGMNSLRSDKHVALSVVGTVYAGLEITPPQYPKTTLMTDIAYLPLLRQSAPDLEWAIGWGVRYQALKWGSIELAVRHREGEGLGDSTVMVRVNAVVR